jgi:hypothetical protein
MDNKLMCCRTCKWHRYPDEPPNYVKNNHVCIRLPVFAVVYNVVDPDIDDQEAFVDDTIYNHGQKLIVCTTTSFQEDSNKMLKLKGFQRTKSMDKSKHSESKLIMWWRRPGGA